MRVRQCAPRVHRILPRVRDDLEPPLVWDRTAEDVEVIWVRSEPEYFCREDWGVSSIQPDEGRYQMDCGEEISSGFVVACRDGAEFL
jgi:hypothetical protein